MFCVRFCFLWIKFAYFLFVFRQMWMTWKIPVSVADKRAVKSEWFTSSWTMHGIQVRFVQKAQVVSLCVWFFQGVETCLMTFVWTWRIRHGMFCSWLSRFWTAGAQIMFRIGQYANSEKTSNYALEHAQPFVSVFRENCGEFFYKVVARLGNSAVTKPTEATPAECIQYQLSCSQLMWQFNPRSLRVNFLLQSCTTERILNNFIYDFDLFILKLCYL